jgi:acyl-CoA synthetase (AMP-forming)/AMP-acid ligase II
MSEAAYQTLLEPIAERAEREPDWPAIVLVYEEGRRDVISAARLFAEIRARSSALAAAGVQAGDICILALGHGLDLVASFLALMDAGAVPSCFPMYLDDRRDLGGIATRLREHVRAFGARCVLGLPSHVDKLKEVLAGFDTQVLDATKLPSAASPGAPERHEPRAQDTAFLQITSGTSGPPKGIAHTHERVLRYIATKSRTTPMSPKDVVVNWVPLYHDLGLLSGLLAPQVLGARAALISPLHWVRDPKILLLTMQELGGTLSFAPNFALSHTVRTVRDRDLEGLDMSGWNALVLGGEPVRVQSMESFAERFAGYGFEPRMFHCGYGMAECIEAAAATPRERPPTVDWIDLVTLQGAHRATPIAPGSAGAVPIVSCGTPNPLMNVRIAGDGGKSLDERCVGEIALQSSYMFDGYYGRPDLSAASLRDGWFFTGDLGYMAGGELYVTGRLKDLIIVGGRNIYPEDVELAAEEVEGTHPGRTVAFGIADELAGTERVILVCEIPPDTGAEDKTAVERRLRQHVVSRLDVALGQVHFAPPGWIIKSSSGKKSRPANREKYLGAIGARAAQ